MASIPPRIPRFPRKAKLEDNFIGCAYCGRTNLKLNKTCAGCGAPVKG